MKRLLDTHVLIWAAYLPERPSGEACALLDDKRNELIFSAASLWDVAIKSGLGGVDFEVDSRLL